MSFNEKLSYTEHVVTTPATDFSIGFKDYGEPSDTVKVTVDGVPAADAGYTVFRKNAMTIALEPEVTSGIVRLQRETNIDSSFYRFTAGAKFVAANMDANFEQILHSQQETRDSFDFLESNTLGVVEAAKEATERANEAADLVEDLIVGKVQTTNVYLPDGSTQQDFNTRVFNTRVETIADLPTNALDGDVVYVKGYYKPTNLALAQPYIGGGTRVYVASRKTENDNFLCINGWVLQVENNTVTPEQAGAKAGDKAFDSSVAIQKTLGKGFITQLQGVYYTQKPIYYSNDDVIQGVSEGLVTGIIKVNNATLSIGNKVINNVTMNFDVDVVLIAIPDKNWYVNHAHLSNFFLGYDDALLMKGTTLYAPLIAMSSFTNMRIGNGYVGIKTVDAWMIKWDRVQSSADTPWWLGAEDTNWSANGTSNTFISCWAQNAKNYTWRINSLRYSTFVSCGTDHTGLDGAPADSVFRITNSDITFDGMGSEVIHAYCYLHAENSLLTFKNIAVQAFYNKYKVQNPQWFSAAACFRILANSKVTLDGGHFDGWRTSIDSDFAAAFAFVEGDSLFTTSKSLKHFSSLEEVKATDGIFSFSKYGIYKDTAGSIDVAYGNNQIRSGSKFYTIKTDDAILSKSLEIRDQNLNNVRSLGSGILSNGSNTNATTSLNYPSNGNAHLLQQLSAKDDVNQPNCIQFDYAFDSDQNNSTSKPRAFARAATWQKNFSVWVEFLTTGNTTKDANGFIKGASPIVNLFANGIELNDEAELQMIEFEKIGTGDYLIKGALGFAQEGWYIEMPKDANGNVLVAVVYEQLEDATISVKTYSKKFDVETGDVVPNLSNPRDVPEGRWISIRLHSLIGDDLPLEVAD